MAKREKGKKAPSGEKATGIFDFIWKWAPQGNPVERNAKVQFEYFSRNEDGTFNSIDYDGDQTGWYLQGVYQFIRKWRVGARYDALQASNAGCYLIRSP